MAVSSLSARARYLIALVASIGTLASVFTMEYGFGLKPCELCNFQRIPFALAALLSLAALVMQERARHRIMMGILSLLFLASVGLGAYHVAVEKKWISGPTACTSAPGSGAMTIEDLKNQIMAAPTVACDEPQWEWNGVTLAGLNVLWSAALFLFFLRGFLKRKMRHD